MKKKTATQSAFFNPRVLVGFAICVIAAFIALFATARQNDEATAQQQVTLPSERAQLNALAFDESTDLPQPAAPPAAPVRYDTPSLVFLVNTTADTQDATPGDGLCADSGGNCSLRAAITEANTTAAVDTITLPAGTYITTLTGAAEDLNASGDFDITQSVNINGAGVGTTFLQAAAAANTGTQRVLHVINTAAVVTVNINDLTIRYGNETTSTAGGGARVAVIAGSVVTFTNCNLDQNRVAPPANNNCFGGAMIHSNPTATAAAGTVTFNNCRITNNSAVHTGATVNGFAGGIYNQQGTLNLTNCVVSGNSATSFHGGIRTLASTLAGSTTTISNSTVSGNTARGINGAGAEGEGGGVTNINGGSFICTTTINSSTISGNSVQIGGVNGAGTAGGGVENVGASTGATNLNMNNSTVSGNLGADGGGGVYSGGTASAATLDYCTIAGNSATSTTAGFGGGGIWHDGSAGTVTIRDCIVGDNTAPSGPDMYSGSTLAGVITSGNYNHVENVAGAAFAPAANDVTGSDAGLSTLGGYGGPTFVHMPSVASPVLNTIPNGTNGCGTTFVVDQRGFGFGRPASGACEKGSVERQAGDGGATPSPTPSQTPTATATFTPVITPTPTPTVTPPATVCALSQGFEGDAILNILLGGWVIKNQSTTTGTTNWFQGNSTVFPAHQGGPSSYVGANFNATTGTNTISDWLFLPPVTIQNGAQFSFFTRTVDAPQLFGDRLQVRFSTNGTSTNVGVTATDVGDFTNLMLDINPTYSTTGAYPSVWTQFTATVSGVVGSPKGRVAFRYFVESGGPTGANSDYIGIDTVGYNCAGLPATPTPGATATATATATASPVASPTPTPPVTPTPQPTPCSILYDQNNNTVPNATNSQMFGPADVAFDNQAADDFVVPAGPNWIVQQVVVSGIYFLANDGPAPSFNVYFYNDAGGFPGATVSSQLHMPYNCVGACDQTAISVFTVFLGSNVNLAPGTYWVSVQAAMDFDAGGQWGWTDRSVTSNNGAAWQNPGGGFATACNTWGRRGATCGIDAPNPDQAFQIVGCQVASTFSISGTVGQCNTTGPSGIPLDGATVAYAGAGSGSTVTAGGGLYTLSGLAAGTYTVTPSKAARPPGSAGITTTDVIAIQRHFLGLGAPLTGCRLTAADCAAPVGITTGDVIACQRYFLTLTTGVGNVGRYSFSPASRTYLLGSNQVAQNYDTVVFGDVATPFANPRPAPPGGDAPITPTVEAVSLPEIDGGNGIYEVKTSQINAASNIVGFQGDIQFDERTVTFDTNPVQNAGLTAGNWNVSANILEGKGPMRTLRISAYSNDFAPLAGSGTLFALRITPSAKTAQGAQLRWAAPPDQFVFIDADSNMHTVGNAALGNLINR